MRFFKAGALAVLIVVTACGRVPSPSPSPPPVSSVCRPGVAASPSAVIPLPTQVELSAPSPDVVWAFVGMARLFRSQDRGRSWAERPLPSVTAGLTDVSFSSACAGWALQVAGANCASMTVGLWHTDDAGDTWRQLPATGLSGHCLGGLAFVDGQHGFLDANEPSRPATVYASADGGQTWAPARLPYPPSWSNPAGAAFFLKGPVRAAGGRLFAVANGAPAGAGPPGQFVYSSADDGATWSYAAALPGSCCIGYGTAFLTDRHWLLFPGQETNDGGSTWHAWSSNYTQAAGVTPSLVFADASVGYATVRGSIQRTDDGGAHWVAVATPGT